MFIGTDDADFTLEVILYEAEKDVRLILSLITVFSGEESVLLITGVASKMEVMFTGTECADVTLEVVLYEAEKDVRLILSLVAVFSGEESVLLITGVASKMEDILLGTEDTELTPNANVAESEEDELFVVALGEKDSPLLTTGVADKAEDKFVDTEDTENTPTEADGDDLPILSFVVEIGEEDAVL